jgi:hypothetical protein
MADITVEPTEWKMVQFDTDRIVAVAGKLADEVGIKVPIRIEVDETTPLGKVAISSLEPLVVTAESGAFEDPKAPRQLSDKAVADVLGRLFFRIRDRLDPTFGEAPADGDLSLAQSTAWDAYAVGRAVRLGYPASKQRRLYHFRNRHGFSDTADAVFDRLWNAEGLTWSDIQGAVDDTEGTRTPVG